MRGVGILLRKLLEPEQQNGALLDGFPRTKVQVECLKLLFDEMIALRREFSGTLEVVHFKQPIFHIGIGLECRQLEAHLSMRGPTAMNFLSRAG
ncbi:MAG: hypothetical protein WB586_07705 [Chthoniobacterales bacterium]